MNHIPIGASTKAVWLAAIGAGLAFVVEWAQSGTAPTWLAAISGVLVLANNAFRSWQSGQQIAIWTMRTARRLRPSSTTTQCPARRSGGRCVVVAST